MVRDLFQHVSEERRRTAFERFHADNPQVWEEFERRALALIANGRERYSARTIIEVVRWHVDLRTTTADGFKINDHHTPFYARMFAEQHPEHRDFFKQRESA